VLVGVVGEPKVALALPVQVVQVVAVLVAQQEQVLLELQILGAVVAVVDSQPVIAVLAALEL
jgi:hypothetical protein